MFELDRAIADWSADAQPEGCRNPARMAELEDHLRCEIERGREAGLSDEAAFHAAVRRVGTARALAAEHRRARGPWARACAALMAAERAPRGAAARKLLLTNAFLWASLMVAAAFVLRHESKPSTFAWLITGVILPLSWGSDHLLRQALRGGSEGSRR